MTYGQKLQGIGKQEGLEIGMLKGLEKGMQQGMQQEKLIIARNMLLKLHLDIDTVQKATDLTKKELEAILKQME